MGTPAVDLSLQYGGGGSGGGFIGKVHLDAGTYTIKVGSGQYYKRYDSNNYYHYFSIPDTSYISNIVSCSGANISNAGNAPVLSITPIEVILNRAGNAGGTDGTTFIPEDFSSDTSTTGMIVGASIYNGYGVGSSHTPGYQIPGSAGQQPSYAGNGYIKIVKV